MNELAVMRCSVGVCSSAFRRQANRLKAVLQTTERGE
jgi:hypothetical protein